MCKKFRKDADVSFEVSRKTLICGMNYGHVNYEHRCKSCEKKLIKQIDKFLKVALNLKG